MSETHELEKLESFVSTLLDRFNTLQQQNQEMTERLERRDTTIETLENELAEMKDERGEISTRVSGILGKIEEWEAASASATAEEPVAEAAEDEAAIDDEAAAAEGEVAEEKKESGVQGNLFTVEATGQ